MRRTKSNRKVIVRWLDRDHEDVFHGRVYVRHNHRKNLWTISWWGVEGRDPTSKNGKKIIRTENVEHYPADRVNVQIKDYR